MSSTAIVKDIINDVVTQIKSRDNFIDDIDKTLMEWVKDEKVRITYTCVHQMVIINICRW